jgi:hypothetical protein
MKFIYVFILYYPFIHHVIEFFFHGMVVEIVWNNEIQMFFFSNQFIFLKKKKGLCTLLEKN